MQKSRNTNHQVIHSHRWISSGKQSISNLGKWIIRKLIQGYRVTISPDHGLIAPLFPRGVCKFYPTCSSYTQLAVEKHGVRCGLWMGMKRILRCNPWSDGGHDPVP